MRKRKRTVGNRIRGAFLLAIGALSSAMALLSPATARAGEMTPTPERLVLQPPGLPQGQTCQSIAADPEAAIAAGLRPSDLSCRPNNAAFANYVSELGFAIAPSAFYPARTTGIGGFELSLEASYTKVNPDAATVAATGQRTQYWHEGTRGAQDQTTKQSSIVNNSPDSIIQIYALKVRKGLPLGFELAGSFGYVANTSLWVAGGDVRWSIFEGFRSAPLGYLPDVSFGGGVRTLTGSSRFYLTTVGIDVKVSKPFTVADSAQLIPTLGFQRLFIYGDSNVVDSTPNVDALDRCGYNGNDPTTGGPVCRNRLSNGDVDTGDFANSFTFQKVRVHRNRGIVGLNYRYEILWLGSQFAFDLTDPKNENEFLVGGRQWTLSFEAGVHF